MQHYYYMNAAGMKDGPHDLVTVMRRIHAGKIQPDSWVYTGDEVDASPAHRIEELRMFFNRPHTDVRQELGAGMHISLMQLMRQGGHFVSEHQTMAVFAGAILLFSALFGILLNEMLGLRVGIISAWLMLLTLQSFYFVVALRVYRAQNIDVEFIERSLSPITLALVAISLLFAAAIPAGFALLIAPGIAAMLLYSFVPFCIFDQRLGIAGSITASLALLRKLDKPSLLKLCLLWVAYIPCTLLLFPLPLFLPVMVGAFCTVYEDLCAA